MLSDKVVHDLREPVATFLSAYAGMEIIFVPNPGNCGDALIATGTVQAFRRAGVRYRPIGSDEDLSGKHVFLGGGGNLVPQYRDMRDLLEKVWKAERVILLPHTIRENIDLIAKLDSRFALFCRDLPSFNHVRHVNPTVSCILAHDMAFHLDVDGFLSDDALSKEAKSVWTSRLARSGVDWAHLQSLNSVELLRLDVESTGPEASLTIRSLYGVSAVVFDSGRCYQRIGVFWKVFVICDR